MSSEEKTECVARPKEMSRDSIDFSLLDNGNDYVPIIKSRKSHEAGYVTIKAMAPLIWAVTGMVFAAIAAFALASLF